MEDVLNHEVKSQNKSCYVPYTTEFTLTLVCFYVPHGISRINFYMELSLPIHLPQSFLLYALSGTL